MPRYLIVFNQRLESFPERYRVVKDDEDPNALRAAEDLTGTVPEAAADAFYDALVARFPPGHELRAEIVHGTDWEVIERNYAGLFRD
ncbi:MAG: hypothetical protein ACPGOY_09540 [Rhodospirillaceae bacterium]